MEKNEITLLARNDTDEPFKVTFTRDEDKLTITCTCPEGAHGEFCEHKFRLASNDIMMLQHPGQNSAMLSAHVWVIETPISDMLIQLLQLLGEDKLDEEAISKVKADIGKAMREGTLSSS
jgi:hypothetical protein